MDWTAFRLSLQLSLWTSLILLVLGLTLARGLAWRRFPGRGLVEALVALPLVLPPTVLGYYLLVAFGRDTWLGRGVEALTGRPLAFSFTGLLLGSIVYSLPFAVQPMLRAFEAIPTSLRDAARVMGLGRWHTFLRIELPLAWPGVLSGLVLAFAHTMGEFGVVLMVGGNIPGETRTIAIAIYDRAAAFDDRAAALMSGVLLLFALVTIGIVYGLDARRRRADGRR